MKHTAATPTTQQTQALQRFAREQGRTWKAQLNHAWVTGNYGSPRNNAILQTVRNEFGPTWLTRYKLPVAGYRMTVINAGETIKRYASILPSFVASGKSMEHAMWACGCKVDSVYSVVDRSSIPMVNGGPVVEMLQQIGGSHNRPIYRVIMPAVVIEADDELGLPDVECSQCGRVVTECPVKGVVGGPESCVGTAPAKCECVDRGCPVCGGKCNRESTTTLHRVDMADSTGTRFCDGCGTDANESGVFTDRDATPQAHDFQSARFTGARTCTKCGLLPLDDEDLESPCEPSEVA